MLSLQRILLKHLVVLHLRDDPYITLEELLASACAMMHSAGLQASFAAFDDPIVRALKEEYWHMAHIRAKAMDGCNCGSCVDPRGYAPWWKKCKRSDRAPY